MTGELVLRDARASDRDAIRALTLGAYAEYGRTMASAAWSGLERSINHALASASNAERIVAEHDGKLVGSVLLYPASSDAYGGLTAAGSAPELRLLAVDPSARGLGVGRALVNECIRRARSSGATALGLHTSISMRAARGLYDRMGFVRVPELDFTVDESELVEGYRLTL